MKFSFNYAANIDSLKYVLANSNNEHRQKVMTQISRYFIETTGDSNFQSIKKNVETKFTDIDETAEIFHTIGKEFIKLNQYDIAFQSLQYALSIYQENENEIGLAKTKTDMAVIYMKFSDFETANKILRNAIRYFKDIQMNYEEADADIKLGDVFYQVDNFENAKQMFTEALHLLKNSSDSAKIAESYFKIAKTYFAQGNLEKALSFFIKSFDIYEILNEQKGMADVYYETGQVYIRLDDFKKADINFGKSIKLYEKLEDLNGQACSYFALSNYYLSINEKNKGLYYLNEALYAAEFGNSKDLLLDIYKSLSGYYEKEKGYELAINYYKKYSNLKDSLSNENQLLKLSQMKSRFENEAKSELIKQLEADSYFKEQSLKKQQNFLIASIISAILAVIMVFILLSNTRRRKITNLELSEKNKSLQKAEDELIKANSELHKSEKRLKDIVQNMPVLVSASDNDGVFIFWNNACENITGYKADEVINNSDFAEKLMFNAKKTREISINNGNTLLHANEYEIQTKNGEIKDIVWTNMSEVFPVEGWNGWHVGIDVTERNLFAQSLEQETAILNSILDSIPYPIFYKDKEGIYQRANQGFLDLHGLSKETLIGKSDKDVFNEKDAEFFFENDMRILRNNVPFKELRWWKSSTGENRLFDTLKLPLINSNNKVLGVVGISFDLTERHRIEQELKKQKEKAEEADRLKSAFLANMSHEIRSPMNAIIGFGNLVSDSFELDSEVSTYMEYIKQSGTNLLQLVDDIIDIAKLEAGQLKIRNENFDLDQMLNNLKVSTEAGSAKYKKSHLEIRLNIPKDSNNPVINSDELRIKQVLNNFLTNAIKFTDEGYIEFGYQKMADNEILFYTKDTGIGITDADKDLIFERFGQVKETYTRNTSGTGLGLAISKSIVELLGGQIWLDSIVNIGTTFYFKIPVEYSSQKLNKDSEPKYDITNYDWKGKRVLVVEDDDMNFKVLKSILDKTRISIRRAENGQDAIDMALLEENLDLILMDIQLPIINGYDASKKIKSIKNTPIIAVTAYAMPGEKEKSIEAGCEYFITKPFNRKELLFKISELID